MGTRPAHAARLRAGTTQQRAGRDVEEKEEAVAYSYPAHAAAIIDRLAAMLKHGAMQRLAPEKEMREQMARRMWTILPDGSEHPIPWEKLRRDEKDEWRATANAAVSATLDLINAINWTLQAEAILSVMADDWAQNGPILSWFHCRWHRGKGDAWDLINEHRALYTGKEVA